MSLESETAHLPIPDIQDKRYVFVASLNSEHKTQKFQQSRSGTIYTALCPGPFREKSAFLFLLPPNPPKKKVVALHYFYHSATTLHFTPGGNFDDHFSRAKVDLYLTTSSLSSCCI
jgi:hypothetical protein